jgi:hypothetical protein
MKPPRLRLWILALLAFVPCTAWTQAQSPAQEMAAAATAFLDGLDAKQRKIARFEFSSDERFNWDFVPRSRRGLPLKEMTASQQERGRALLRSGLSQQGYARATNIIVVIEQVLRELENGSPRRDSGLYYFTLFGTPGQGAWGWRVEGHHLSLNFTIKNNEVLAFSPSFFGSNPAEVRRGPHQGLRPLGPEEDLARKLLNSLSADQRRVAVIATRAPSDIITGNSRKGRLLEPAGIPARQLTEPQSALLRSLIEEYLFRFRTELATNDLARIDRAGFEKLSFAWAGSAARGEGHYYRVQGPTFLLEYDNTQNNANHIHTVWRDLENDFGEDLLQRHHQEDHTHP